MARWPFAVFMIAVAACAQAPAPAPVAPAQKPAADPSVTAAAHSPQPTQRPTPTYADRAAIASLPDSVAELRIAADSAADAGILEQLEAPPAVTEDEPSALDPSHGPSAGGAKSVTATAVTWDIDVETYANHDRVQYWLDFFQGPARERMAIWLTRMPQYETMIRQRMQQQGLPTDLVYLALIESGYSNRAVSRAKAAGMWQFMKGTARMYGLQVTPWVDERRDPYLATDAAARHLSDLYAQFGSLYLAAAAYNAGAGKVSRGLTKMGLSADEDEDADIDEMAADAVFFRLSDTRLIRQETKDYVPKLIAAAMIAKEPQRYGFDPLPDGTVEVAAWDSVEVPGGTRLDSVAARAGVSGAEVADLNPKYIRRITPPGATSYVRVPAGTGAATTASIEATPIVRMAPKYHTVRKGESVKSIARRYGVTRSALMDANGLSGPRVSRGQQLIIPTELSVPAPAPSASGKSAAAKSRSASSKASRPASQRTYVVRRGDTLSGIAGRYGVSVASIQSANGLKGSTLRAGTKLTIPTS